MSFKAEVTAESSGAWASSALRFATQEEAEKYIMFMHAAAVREARVVEVDDPTNAAFVGDELRADWPKP
jgi:hypothetical protein